MPSPPAETLLNTYLFLPPSYFIYSFIHLNLSCIAIQPFSLCTPPAKGSWRVFDKMESTKIFMAFMLLICTSANAQTAETPTPTPAPAPAPDYVNLTELLSVAGPFSIFLSYLKSTKVIDTFQNQANNTEEGITLFVPKDKAFTSLKSPSISNLTSDQLRSLCLFHAVPHYYSLAEFKNLSGSGPVSTFAGGQYTLNFTDAGGTVLIGTGWTNTKVSSAVHSTDPVAIYQVDKVLLPEAIFGMDIPPMPAPAPAPVVDVAPVADAPSTADGGKGSTVASSHKDKDSSGYRVVEWSVWSCLIMGVLSGFMLFL